MLLTSIFFFSDYVFYSSQNKIQFCNNILSSAKSFNFDQSKILPFGNELENKNKIEGRSLFYTL